MWSDRPLSARTQQHLAWALLITPALVTLAVFGWIALRKADPRTFGSPHSITPAQTLPSPPFVFEATTRFSTLADQNDSWQITMTRRRSRIKVIIYNDQTFTLDIINWPGMHPDDGLHNTTLNITRRDFHHLRMNGEPNTLSITIDEADMWTLRLNEEVAWTGKLSAIKADDGFSWEHSPESQTNAAVEWGEAIVYAP